eukprot:jgi/Botrbrau1/6522/Bobra.0034s0094.1
MHRVRRVRHWSCCSCWASRSCEDVALTGRTSSSTDLLWLLIGALWLQSKGSTTTLVIWVIEAARKLVHTSRAALR